MRLEGCHRAAEARAEAFAAAKMATVAADAMRGREATANAAAAALEAELIAESTETKASAH